MTNPAAFGLTNVTTAFLPSASGDVTQFLFFDSVHFTSTVQQLEAMYLNELLNPEFALAFAPTLGRASLATVNLVADNTVTRLDTIRSNDLHQPVAPSSPTTDAKDGKSIVPPPPARGMAGFGLYAGYSYLNGNRDGDSGSYGVDYETNMGTVGLDYTMKCGLTLGVSGSFGQTAVDVSNGGTFSLDNQVINGYAMWRRRGSFFIDGSFGGGWVDVNKIRRPTNVPGITTEGGTSGELLEGHVRVGYELYVARDFVIGPVVGYRFIQSKLDAYTESNGAGLDFHYDEQTLTSNIGTFGAFAHYQGKIGRMDTALRLNCVYLHDFSDDSHNFSGRLADNISNPVSLASDDGYGDMVNIGVGVTGMLTRHLGLNVDYVGGIPSEGNYHNRVSASLSLSF